MLKFDSWCQWDKQGMSTENYTSTDFVLFSSFAVVKYEML